ncbi:cytidine deaminase [Terribacillus saccharophilus]|uniref:Cytidine deaminase n=1 Tax=Terribacillus saccharophilus TaxID=361277 RepID=A0A268HAH3_9BACI|nr:cytidine deaminase [Terribacillus saccharophilus]
MIIMDLLYEAAIQLIQKRYPSGWGGAAAMRTSEGVVLTSVAPEVLNAATELCMEVGSILEAHKLQTSVTHSICVTRDDENSSFKVLTPCGICQERLLYWGRDVQVAVTHEENKVKYVSLQELQPFHWTHAYPEEEIFGK